MNPVLTVDKKYNHFQSLRCSQSELRWNHLLLYSMKEYMNEITILRGGSHSPIIVPTNTRIGWMPDNTISQNQYVPDLTNFSAVNRIDDYLVCQAIAGSQ